MIGVTCYVEIDRDAEGKSIACGKPVRHEGSFVCEEHVVKYKDAKRKKNWTVKEMQEELRSWRTKHS